MKKYSFKKTIVGHFNLREEGSDQIVATIPFEALAKLLPGVSERRFCGTVECTEGRLDEVLNG